MALSRNLCMINVNIILPSALHSLYGFVLLGFSTSDFTHFTLLVRAVSFVL